VLVTYLKSHITSIQTSHLRLMIGAMGCLNRCDMPNWERALGRWLKPAVTRCDMCNNNFNDKTGV
jgi:transposase-like protein